MLSLASDTTFGYYQTEVFDVKYFLPGNQSAEQNLSVQNSSRKSFLMKNKQIFLKDSMFTLLWISELITGLWVMLDYGGLFSKLQSCQRKLALIWQGDQNFFDFQIQRFLSLFLPCRFLLARAEANLYGRLTLDELMIMAQEVHRGKSSPKV